MAYTHIYIRFYGTFQTLRPTLSVRFPAGVLVSSGCSDLCHQLDLGLNHAPLARATVCPGLSLRELPTREAGLGAGRWLGRGLFLLSRLDPLPQRRLWIWPERGKQFPQPGSQDSDSEMSLVRGLWRHLFTYL